MSWNHNDQYHAWVLSDIPRDCKRALDPGCGRGALARKLARRRMEVIGLDVDHECLRAAMAADSSQPNLTFLRTNILEPTLAPDCFDFVVTVAALHHLPLRPALDHLGRILRPGGVLVVIGLYRSATPLDFAAAAAAFPVSRILRGEAEVGAPLHEPAETLHEIRTACDSVLPGGVFLRCFFFRYSFVWRKPVSDHG